MNPYDRTFNGAKLDPYRILTIYEITDPAIQHAIKKLLRCGRGTKDINQDVRDSIEPLERFEEMQRETPFPIGSLENVIQSGNVYIGDHFMPPSVGIGVVLEYIGNRTTLCGKWATTWDELDMQRKFKDRGFVFHEEKRKLS